MVSSTLKEMSKMPGRDGTGVKAISLIKPRVTISALRSGSIICLRVERSCCSRWVSVVGGT